jgi:hypothetical protein
VQDLDELQAEGLDLAARVDASVISGAGEGEHGALVFLQQLEQRG